MAGIADNRAVFHRFEMLSANDVNVAGHGHENIADFGGFGNRHDLIAVHRRFDGANRLDFNHDDFCAHAIRPHGDAAPAPAIAAHHKSFARHKRIRRPHNPVHRALACAVAVIEEMLGLRVIHRNDRIAQHLAVCHAAQPNYAGRRLFRAADDMLQQVFALGVNRGDDIRAVVHRHHRLMFQRGVNMLVIRLVVLAFDGKRRNVVMFHQRSGHVVLRA